MTMTQGKTQDTKNAFWTLVKKSEDRRSQKMQQKLNMILE